jgi:Rieske Fe-S protein
MAPTDDREPSDEAESADADAEASSPAPEPKEDARPPSPKSPVSPASGGTPAPSPRRDFLSIAVGGSMAAFAVAVGYPVARFIEPHARPPSGTATVGKIEDFPIGQAKIVLVAERPVLVIRTTDGQFRAFSAVCSHLQCVVNYVPERNQIECPCHQGIYSIDGQNISGPPPRPLEEMVVTVNEGSVIVSTA